RQNADTVNTPARFRSVAADIQMDFALATADINGRATSGIIRKHTNTDWWLMDDEIKSSGSGGDDAWDSRYYLNIWVGNLQAVLGYASVPGGPVEKDGVVISTNAFGTINSSAPYNLGRTAVHETGHWMGLKHPWGDTYCGDDKVDDTPKQGSFTTGCPGGVFRSSCDNGALGDMYMNYMDFTDDACMNLFTAGQKQRMLSLFNPGGPRNLLLSSKGLQSPWVFTSLPKTDETPHLSSSVHVYPNPASNEINLNLDDNTWIGNDINLLNLNGTLIISQKITSTTQKINVDQLKPGMYFIEANSNNGKIRQRFLKL
ncbi:MAG TPA: zinc-dependent metalloprotease, partial [Flavisolibacter sp.]|nr:zinc-dependent metalloprotease [Flavisolibacter sp.]